jgi:hypothetical protein
MMSWYFLGLLLGPWSKLDMRSPINEVGQPESESPSCTKREKLQWPSSLKQETYLRLLQHQDHGFESHSGHAVCLHLFCVCVVACR